MFRTLKCPQCSKPMQIMEAEANRPATCAGCGLRFMPNGGAVPVMAAAADPWGKPAPQRKGDDDYDDDDEDDYDDDDIPLNDADLPDASLLDRFFGALVDNIILAVFTNVASFYALRELAEELRGASPEAAVEWVLESGWIYTYITRLLLAAGFYLALQSILIVLFQRSVGKFAVGTKIITDDGDPPGFFRGVMLRTVIFTIACQFPCLGTLLAIADPFFIFRKDSKCIHDHIAGTRVVVAKP